MSELIAKPLSAVRSENIKWLWEPYLPRGKLALLDGDPGVGKSLLTIDLAARLSRGGQLPDGKPVGRPHVTLLLNAEDAAADTTRPRAEAARADLDRVIVVTDSHGLPLQFPADDLKLAKLALEHRPDLIVIDPIMAFLPAEIAANSDQCVRGVLSTLSILAERIGCAILLIRHLRKAGAKAIYRGLGSVGFIGSVRTGLLAARHPTDPTLGVLMVSKANLAGPVPSLGYRIAVNDAGKAVVEWTGPTEADADVLAQLPPAPLRVRDRVASWLRGELSHGPRKAVELYEAAARASIPERTLNRAKSELDARSHRASVGGKIEWYWYDATAAWPEDAPFKRPLLDDLPPLEELR